MTKICLITVVDIVSATSIPINEFVVYRNRKYSNYRQTILTRTSENRGNVSIPKDISTYVIPSSMIKFRTLIKKLLDECKKNDEQVVFHLHHQKSALMFFMATLLLGVWNKTVFTIHSFYRGRDIYYRLSSCLCALLANRTNCVSEAALEDYNSLIKLIKGHRMGAIPNGIDCERIKKALAGQNRPEDLYDMKRIVCVDRIIPLKNQSFLIGLLKFLPDTKLILIGKEDNNHAIRKKAEKEGVINRVEFLGLMPREDVYRELYKCGMYISASTVEGLHLSVLEALKVGAIPLISNIPAHQEIAAKCDRLFETLPLNEEDWVKKIKEYQSSDSIYLGGLISQLTDVVEKYFSLDKMHDQYDLIYHEIINSHAEINTNNV